MGTTAAVGPAAAPPFDPALAAIRDEGLNRSEVMDTAETLCDVIGPRLTGSAAVRRANGWTRDTLARWGLAAARLEPWGPFGEGWALDKFSLRVTSPAAFQVHGEPKAWTGGLPTPLSAPVVYLDTRTEAGLAAYQADVRGAIVLIGRPRALDAGYAARATRYGEDDLAAMAGGRTTELMHAAPPLPNPTTGPGATIADRRPPTTGHGDLRGTGPAAELGAGDFAAKALKFAADHGAALVLTPSVGDGGTVFVAQAALSDTTPRRGPDGATTQPRVWWPDGRVLPQATVTAEDFNRLVSLSRHHLAVRATAELVVRRTGGLPQQYDTVAEIPGTDLADQVVMAGAHLDSWHAGTGATDNAAGVACAMEAVRLIRACGLHPRRTIRVGLWTGEEQGLLGSGAYVKAHFGVLSTDAAATPVTRPSAGPAAPPDARAPLTVAGVAATRPATRPVSVVKAGDGREYDRFAVYFNLDNGTGRIRGIYAQHNTAAAALFADWLKPLRDLGATTVTPQETGFTDHVAFDRVGLPGFQFIQDPIEYFTRTHHSNADTFDRLQPEDLKQASVVLATFLWDAANTDGAFPRKPLTR